MGKRGKGKVGPRGNILMLEHTLPLSLALLSLKSRNTPVLYQNKNKKQTLPYNLFNIEI